MGNGIENIKDFYDFKSDKFQNFEYLFLVEDQTCNKSKKVTVHATGIIVAKDRLIYFIGNQFKVYEL